MIETLGTIVLSFAAGSIAWLATNFVGKPIVTMYELRGKVHEEMIVTANIFVPDTDDGSAEVWEKWRKGPEGQRYEKAYNDLRRLGARLAALNISPRPAKYLLHRLGFDLVAASGALIGVSNLLDRAEKGSRALVRNSAEVALKLPRTYSDQDIERVKAQVAGRQQP